jgi:hypothetical protein
LQLSSTTSQSVPGASAVTVFTGRVKSPIGLSTTSPSAAISRLALRAHEEGDLGRAALDEPGPVIAAERPGAEDEDAHAKAAF